MITAGVFIYIIIITEEPGEKARICREMKGWIEGGEERDAENCRKGKVFLLKKTEDKH